ncbi:Histidine ammonia-lyase [Pandoraea communis]|uniref:tyrosine ammonia-lyase n=1 Tax=Pandoraea communis TaxID=2508297 RepID=A0A5E4VV75_9BURK|nr:aromatic amino acid ammonia-lyase [Pandoraea communis]VVE15479.1 Histidine ammonia-lyase [Pandoraea communis]
MMEPPISLSGPNDGTSRPARPTVQDGLPGGNAGRADAAAVVFGPDRLTIEDILALAHRTRVARLSAAPAWQDRIRRGVNALHTHLAAGRPVYGVTTGYGDACVVDVPASLIDALPAQLTRYHGCGMGEWLDDDAVRAVLACRLASLVQGYSAVRPELLEALVHLLAHDVLPRIPAEGSVGASGDLTPLSYVAATLIGERDVMYRGRLCAASDALAATGGAPIRLAPKEGLALMNGTAVMTALASLAFARSRTLARLASRLTALTTVALDGRAAHFHPTLFDAKPHEGQREAARWIRDDLAGRTAPPEARLQDRYSLRCAPHVVGVLVDALSWVRRDVENEINSANDNPLIDPDTGEVHHGGNFYGGHIAFAMDSLKTAVANIADLMDRQLALLVDDKFNNGLPRNLSGATGPRAPINHGFKAVQIGASAWAAEALKHTMPASVFSRSTESHNQDKVSMGTIAARDCLRVLMLTEQVAAAHTLAVAQAVRLRVRLSPGDAPLPGTLRQWLDAVAAHSPFVEEDRALEHELRAVRAWLADGGDLPHDD